MKPFQDLFKGQLVRLCAPRPEDGEIIASWTEDAAYQRPIDTEPAKPAIPQAISRWFSSESNNSYYFHLRTLAEDRLVGFIVIHSIEWSNGRGVLSMGIGGAENRGLGYGSDALLLMLNYAFNELNLYRVGLDVIGSNLPAIRIYQKAGFKEEGRIREAINRDNTRVDLVLMGITRPEWEARGDYI